MYTDWLLEHFIYIIILLDAFPYAACSFTLDNFASKPFQWEHDFVCALTANYGVFARSSNISLAAPAQKCWHKLTEPTVLSQTALGAPAPATPRLWPCAWKQVTGSLLDQSHNIEQRTSKQISITTDSKRALAGGDWAALISDKHTKHYSICLEKTFCMCGHIESANHVFP